MTRPRPSGSLGKSWAGFPNPDQESNSIKAWGQFDYLDTTTYCISLSGLRNLQSRAKFSLDTTKRKAKERTLSKVLETVLIILGALLQIVGLAGCVLPWIAGPPFNLLGLVLLCLAKGWETFSPSFLIIMAALTLLTVVTDYALPLAGAKKFGSSRRGFWGSFVGMFIGVFFFPPFGLVIGAFLGAVLGELSAGKMQSEALKAGWGVFAGVMVSLIFKVIVSGLMTFSFFRALF